MPSNNRLITRPTSNKFMTYIITSENRYPDQEAVKTIVARIRRNPDVQGGVYNGDVILKKARVYVYAIDGDIYNIPCWQGVRCAF